MEPIGDEALEKMTNEPGWRLNRTLWLALIARLRAAEAKALPDGHVRIDGRIYRTTPALPDKDGRVWAAALTPLPATPEEDDDG